MADDFWDLIDKITKPSEPEANPFLDFIRNDLKTPPTTLVEKPHFIAPPANLKLTPEQIDIQRGQAMTDFYSKNILPPKTKTGFWEWFHGLFKSPYTQQEQKEIITTMGNIRSVSDTMREFKNNVLFMTQMKKDVAFPYTSPKMTNDYMDSVNNFRWFTNGISLHYFKPQEMTYGDGKITNTDKDAMPTVSNRISSMVGSAMSYLFLNTLTAKALSKIPIVSRLATKAITSPWKIGFPLNLGLSGATGAVVGGVTYAENAKQRLKNIGTTAGMYVLFTAIAYPLIQFFKPVITKEGEIKFIPKENSTKLANGIADSIKTEKPLYFKSPADKNIIMKVTPTTVKVGNVKDFALAKNTAQSGSLIDANIEIFKENPSLYNQLRNFIKGTISPTTTVMTSPESAVATFTNTIDVFTKEPFQLIPNKVPFATPPVTPTKTPEVKPAEAIKPKEVKPVEKPKVKLTPEEQNIHYLAVAYKTMEDTKKLKLSSEIQYRATHSFSDLVKKVKAEGQIVDTAVVNKYIKEHPEIMKEVKDNIEIIKAGQKPTEPWERRKQIRIGEKEQVKKVPEVKPKVVSPTKKQITAKYNTYLKTVKSPIIPTPKDEWTKKFRLDWDLSVGKITAKEHTEALKKIRESGVKKTIEKNKSDIEKEWTTIRTTWVNSKQTAANKRIYIKDLQLIKTRAKGGEVKEIFNKASAELKKITAKPKVKKVPKVKVQPSEAVKKATEKIKAKKFTDNIFTHIPIGKEFIVKKDLQINKIKIKKGKTVKFVRDEKGQNFTTAYFKTNKGKTFGIHSGLYTDIKQAIDSYLQPKTEINKETKPLRETPSIQIKTYKAVKNPDANEYFSISSLKEKKPIKNTVYPFSYKGIDLFATKIKKGEWKVFSKDVGFKINNSEASTKQKSIQQAINAIERPGIEKTKEIIKKIKTSELTKEKSIIKISGEFTGEKNWTLTNEDIIAMDNFEKATKSARNKKLWERLKTEKFIQTTKRGFKSSKKFSYISKQLFGKELTPKDLNDSDMMAILTDCLDTLKSGKITVDENLKLPRWKKNKNGWYISNEINLGTSGFINQFRPVHRVLRGIGVPQVGQHMLEAAGNRIREKSKVYEQLLNLEKEVKKTKLSKAEVFDTAEDVAGHPDMPSEVRSFIRYWDPLRKDLARRQGLPEELWKPDYVPHYFEKLIERDILENKEDAINKWEKIMEYDVPQEKKNPKLSKRLGRTVGLKKDVFYAVRLYVADSLAKIHYDPVIEEINKLIKQENIPAETSKYLKKIIQESIIGRPTQLDMQTKTEEENIDKMVQATLKKIKVNYEPDNVLNTLSNIAIMTIYDMYLGGYPLSAIKNFFQKLLSYAVVSNKAFAKGMAMGQTVAGRAFAKEHSNVYALRMEGSFIAGLDKTLTNLTKQKFHKTLMFLFRAADLDNVIRTFLAGYYEAKSYNLPEDICIKRGDEVATRSQYLYSKLFRPAMFRSNVGRVLSTFTSWPLNFMEYLKDIITGNVSDVYTEYFKANPEKLNDGNKKLTHKSVKGIIKYLILLIVAGIIQKKSRVRAFEYTGITSIKRLAYWTPTILSLAWPVARGIIYLTEGNVKSAVTQFKKLSPTQQVSFIRTLKYLGVWGNDKDILRAFFLAEKKPKTKYTQPKFIKKTKGVKGIKGIKKPPSP